jgi:hypothetical protein
MTEFAGGNIEAFCGPTELGAPDDLEQTIIDFINGATRSLLIAVQEIDSMLIAQAILDARLRKVRAWKSRPTTSETSTSPTSHLMQARRPRRPRSGSSGRGPVARIRRC